jgi:hypothetical protein
MRVGSQRCHSKDLNRLAQALGVIPRQTFARLRKKDIAHEPHDRLDWVQSDLVLLGYAVYDETP